MANRILPHGWKLSQERGRVWTKCLRRTSHILHQKNFLAKWFLHRRMGRICERIVKRRLGADYATLVRIEKLANHLGNDGALHFAPDCRKHLAK